MDFILPLDLGLMILEHCLVYRASDCFTVLFEWDDSALPLLDK